MRTSKRERESIYNACYGHEGIIVPSDDIDLEEVRRLTEDAAFADKALALLRSMRENHEHVADRADEVDALLEREGGE